MTLTRNILMVLLLLSVLFVAACQQQQSIFPTEPPAPGGEENLAGEAYQYGEALPTSEYGLPYDTENLYGDGRVLLPAADAATGDDAFFFTLPEPFAPGMGATADALHPQVHAPGGLMYKRGYVFKAGSWVPFEYTPLVSSGGSVKQVMSAAGELQDTNWISTAADAVVPFVASEFTPGENFIVAYVCFKRNPSQPWKCGCNQPGEASCKRWTLQKFMVCGEGQVVGENGECSVPSGDAEGAGGAEGDGTGVADSGTGEGGTIAAVCAEVIPPADTTTMPTAQSECVPPNTDGTQNVLGICADEYTVVSYGCGSQTDTCTHDVRYDCGAAGKVCSNGVCVDAATGAGSGTGTGGLDAGTESGAGTGSGSGTGPGGASDSGSARLTLTSNAFDDGSSLLIKYADIPSRCTEELAGTGVSPPLTIQNVPETAQSLALVMEDTTINVPHWIVWNIPKRTSELSEGVSISSLGSVKEWDPDNSGDYGYRGPCPPEGETHTYRFTLYALDDQLSGFTRHEWNGVLDALSQHQLDSAILTATYPPTS